VGLNQPSLRDWRSAALDPGVETPGYSHEVPSGRQDRAIVEDIGIVVGRLQ
jgi:hypothetical protein